GRAMSTSETRSLRPSRWLVWCGLIAGGVIFTYPLVWLLSASFKPRPDVFDNRLIPKTWAPENYVLQRQQGLTSLSSSEGQAAAAAAC
ncbi:MAG: hypothetical protein ACR2GB_02265, partial [Nocardioidaceae bacterium]